MASGDDAAAPGRRRWPGPEGRHRPHGSQIRGGATARPGGGGAESSEIENDGNRAPTHAEKKSRFSARFSLSMGTAMSARLLDLMLLDRALATIFCGSMAAAICASKRRRGCSRKVTFAARLGRRLDGDLRQQDAVTRG